MCTRLDLVCHWSEAAKSRQAQSNSVKVLSIVNLSREELRSLAYYRENLMQNLSVQLHNGRDGFWDGDILRLCHRHRFLECFVVALSSIDESRRLRTDVRRHDEALKRYAFSLEMYQEGIAGLRNMVARETTAAASNEEGANAKDYVDSIALILASCLVCISIETWHGDNHAAIRHAIRGYQLANSTAARAPIAKSNGNFSNAALVQILIAMLQRVTALFGVTKRKVLGQIQIHAIPSIDINVEDKSLGPELLLDPTASINDLQRYFYKHLGDYVLRIKHSDRSQIAVGVDLARKLQNLLNGWHRVFLAAMKRFEAYSGTTGAGAASVTRDTHLMLIDYHVVSALLLPLALDSEVAFDAHQDTFARVLDLAELFLPNSQSHGASSEHGNSRLRPDGRHQFCSQQSMEPSLIHALMFVVCKCRHPQIRRRALRMLYRARRQEGLAHSAMMGALGEQYIAIEEGGLQPEEIRVGRSEMGNTSTAIPKGLRRVRQHSFKYDPGFLCQAHSSGSDNDDPEQQTLCDGLCASRQPSVTYRYFFYNEESDTSVDCDIQVNTSSRPPRNDPPLIQSATVRLKSNASPGGCIFGAKSEFWYPICPHHAVMDEEIPEETRSLEGPHPGFLPIEGAVSHGAESLLGLRLSDSNLLIRILQTANEF